mmetsp:Transcript_69379/g.144682  ORF Transcript_69379/g.144682 Transcript_69379/m.144682 type:complete len:150 (+) Transcript_69379:89-538(+)|eukprot:CAMPEP_0181321396 /NCGR_PEP_ID=MMETSP1101-20121128/18658_1 /TAXON_ID=46948 /ORGANISM="Rhodomonas abbreviata, Strain Caron Lab Isolate" /LENGTH=149 /DNA_ID=CAMNT_0023429211 /DNA_START=69 /DNA_END=518 /DNA_ORIENTATION=-
MCEVVRFQQFSFDRAYSYECTVSSDSVTSLKEDNLIEQGLDTAFGSMHVHMQRKKTEDNTAHLQEHHEEESATQQSTEFGIDTPSQSEYFAARAAHNRVVGAFLLPEKQMCERTRSGRAVGAWLHEEASYGSDEEELGEIEFELVEFLE